MGDVLWAANVFLAGDNSLQRQDANLSSKPIQHLGSFILVVEGFQAIDAIEKIHQCIVVESYNGASEDLSAEFFCDIESFDIAALREFQPDVGIQGGGGNPLQNGCRHSGELKPNAFLCERVNKPSERRWAWCIAHLSSGVAERLRANRILSCSLRPGTFFRSLSMLWRFFFTCQRLCRSTR